MDKQTKFLTVDEAASKYRVDRSTLFRWRQNGKISSIKISRKKVLFNEQTFEVQNYAKMIFNANELPKDTEQNNAFYRRFIIIPFDITIPSEEQDRELHQKIISNELAGVFKWVLDGLKRLLLNKNFTNCNAIEKMNKDLVKTGEDATNEYFTAYYQGQPITFSKNKLTGEVHINADQAIKAMGFDGDFMDYLGTDEGLDLISDWKKDHPDIPFFGNALKTSKQSN